MLVPKVMKHVPYILKLDLQTFVTVILPQSCVKSVFSLDLGRGDHGIQEFIIVHLAATRVIYSRDQVINISLTIVYSLGLSVGL